MGYAHDQNEVTLPEQRFIGRGCVQRPEKANSIAELEEQEKADADEDS